MRKGALFRQKVGPNPIQDRLSVSERIIAMFKIDTGAIA